MKISRRIFITLISTTFLVGLLIILYFVLLLPGLYADAKEQEYPLTTETFHRSIMRQTFSLDTPVSLGNLSGASIRMPLKGYTLDVFSSYVSYQIEVVDPELRAVMDQFRDSVSNLDDAEDPNFDTLFGDIDLSDLNTLLEDRGFTSFVNVSNFELANITIDDAANSTHYMTTDNILIVGNRINSSGTLYSNYFAISSDAQYLYFSSTYAVTPNLTELRPIVMNSVPMILGLLILVTIIASGILSRYLGKPVEVLAMQVKRYDINKSTVFKQPNRGDEFEALEHALNTMSSDLLTTLNVLNVQNQALETAKKRQELFMTHATHQLKTPLSSASLLIQGLIDGVGPYKDPNITLPKVLGELKKMNEIIHASLNVTPTQKAQTDETINLTESLQSILAFYHTKSTDKKLNITVAMEPFTVNSDPHLLMPSLENIISNAVKFTPSGSSILIEEKQGILSILSENTFIEEDLLPHIKDPFIRSHTEIESGTGLGLYLVDTFLNILNIPWSITNTDKGVCVSLNLEEIRC